MVFKLSASLLGFTFIIQSTRHPQSGATLVGFTLREVTLKTSMLTLSYYSVSMLIQVICQQNMNRFC
jgi:hypothetical protein